MKKERRSSAISEVWLALGAVPWLLPLLIALVMGLIVVIFF
jgi:hypothetical protein